MVGKLKEAFQESNSLIPSHLVLMKSILPIRKSREK